MKPRYANLFFIFTVFLVLSVSSISSAQTESVQPKFKQVIVYIPKTKARHIQREDFSHEIDSLKNVIRNLDSLNQLQLAYSKVKDSILNQSDQKFQRLAPVVNELQLQVAKYQALNIQTEKSNFILLVFNSFVSLLLFIMFMRYLIRLRKIKKNRAIKLHDLSLKEDTQPNTVMLQNKIETNLKQLEKLGRLRNSGILTEEEFIFQKQQILGH